jgi:hypothetical protein
MASCDRPIMKQAGAMSMRFPRIKHVCGKRIAITPVRALK